MELDAFTRAYIECALWSSNDNSTPQGGDPLDRNYGVTDIDPRTLAAMAADCERFQLENQASLESVYASGFSPTYNAERAGHDFWLTRNAHGAGFWDGDIEYVAGQKLTDAAHAFGEVELYVGDDGKIYA
jgi:hypothetical protein